MCPYKSLWLCDCEILRYSPGERRYRIVCAGFWAPPNSCQLFLANRVFLGVEEKNAFAKMPNAGEQLKQTPHCTCPQYPRDCQLNEAKPAPEHKRSAPKVAIVTVQRPISRRHYLATRCAPGCMHMRMGMHMHVHMRMCMCIRGSGSGSG